MAIRQIENHSEQGMNTSTEHLIGSSQSGKIFSTDWRSAHGGTITVVEKATGDWLFQAGVANAQDIAAAAVAARDAQVEWAAVPGPLRADVLRKFSALLEANADEVTTWIVQETGSIQPKARFEIAATAREALEAAALASRPVGEMLATTGGRPSYAERVPVGVVGLITPWNSPLILAARALFPALVLGNAVVLKPDIQTPVSGGLLIARLFEEAGLPPGVLHVVPGGPEAGEALVADPHVSMISFTGSTNVGRRIGEVAGRLLKRTALELGGNNALIILDDADLERASSAGAFSSFFHQGQICFSAGRHLVHESVLHRYTELLARRASTLQVGDPHRQHVHIGPMINARQAERARQIVAESVALGAKIEAGGNVNGLYFEPTVLSGVTAQMPVFSEEIFAPVAPITSFSTDEQAIALANDTEYGLAASVFSANEARAVRIAKRLKTGIAHVNDQTVVHEIFGPIGGTGASGNGARSGNVTSLDEYTYWRWLTVAETVPDYPF
ncbi:benzaldehyde dehydrogenase [Paraburkholderia silviterrae]